MNIGPAVEQKEQALVAIALSALLSAIHFAPIGYPHNKLIIHMSSHAIPNNFSVTENLIFGFNFNAIVVSTVNGNSAGSTLYAHTVNPSKKLCIYLLGADMKTPMIAAISSVIVARIYFTR